MHRRGTPITLAAAAALALGAAAAAQTVVTQWNFNSPLNDDNVGTGTTSPSIRAGTASTVGAVIMSFASGDSETGSTDPATVDDSGWQLTNFPAQGTGSGTSGAVFSVSTAGFTGISIMFDLRASTTSSRWWQVFYSTDGVNFVPGPQFSASSGAERWYNQRTVSLAGVSAAGNNPNFRFRIAPVFDPGLGTAYSAASTAAVYDQKGAYRLDMVTVLGTPTGPVQPSLVATANPPAACTSGGQVRLQAAVVRGTNPNSSSINVRANLSALGGSATQSLFDNGTGGDITPNDNNYTFLYTVPAGLAPGARTIPVTFSDGQGRTATSSVVVTIADCSQNAPSRVVISQVYGGGGNTPPPASPYNADYVELYNRSSQPVDLTGWSVQYAPPFEAAGFADPRNKVDLAGVIQPGQHLLVLFTVPNSIGSALQTADFVSPARTGLGHTGGRVALVRSTALLGASCGSAETEDLVGYGLAATCFEGAAPSPNTDNDTAATRKLGGAQDTNQSFNDFLSGPPQPHNRTAGGFLAGYGSLSAPGVCAGSPVTISVSVSPATTAPGPSTGLVVSADLSAIGGPAAAAMTDGGGGVFTVTPTVAASTPQGVRTIAVTVADAQGRTDRSFLSLAVGACAPSPSRVVISGVFAGGGNNLAAYNADFVEIFNRSDQPVDLTGWSLQYAAADDPLGFVGAPDLLPLSGVIGPGQYRLIQTGAAGTTGAPIPTPDFIASPSIGLDNEFGRLALVRSTAALGASCSGAAVEDLVAYGSPALCFEGVAPADKLTNSQVLSRRGGGCQDTDQNAVDWVVVAGASAPARNSVTPASICVQTTPGGACCAGATCSVTTQAACAGPATAFAGANTVCNAPGNLTSPCCTGDFNHQGGVTVQDIFDFLTAYFVADPRADVNAAGGVTVQDVFDFLRAYFNGCA